MEAFEKVRQVIENNRLDDSDPYYWELYIANTPSPGKRAEKVGHNYTVPEKDESLRILESNMQIMGESGLKYFVVVLKTSRTSPNGFTIPVLNPLYRGYSGAAGIGSLNNNGSNNNGHILDMQRQMFEMQMEFQNQLHKIEMDRLKEDINAAINHKETVMEKVVSYMSKPEFAPIIAGLINRLTPPAAVGAPVSAPVPAPAAIEQNIDNGAAGNNAADPTEQQQVQEAQKIMAVSIRKIDAVFPGETLQFMQELANYIEANPTMAAQIRGMLKGQQNNE